MAATIFQTNFYDQEKRKKILALEMSEPTLEIAAKDIAFNSSIHLNTTSRQNSMYSPEMPYIQTEIKNQNPLQGSMLSLGARSYVDHSDIQPLTYIHACRSDECNKFHHRKPENEEIENPISPLKNFFLYLVIFLLAVWIVVYTLLSQHQII